ncbi:Ribonuclease Z [Shigella flexneri 2002017]|nr:Ribonuclease Z [Shigella flexneri 2002017]
MCQPARAMSRQYCLTCNIRPRADFGCLTAVKAPSISYCIPPLTLENWTRFLSVTFMAIIFFGLPGLLCSRSMSGIIQPLTIYGPQGIREFVETALRISGSWTDYPLEIVEIGAGEILDDGLRKVTAYPLEHPLECYGYRIEEHDKPGALNAQALKAAGVPPGPLFQELKAGKTITLEDGRQINGADYLAAPVPGKALAIFGDTGPCDAALDLAKGVDVMVHEATLDITMEAKANSRGHSSTRQAATLAREAGVGKLIITHVSSRYDDKGCQHLLRECRSIFPATELANDFTVFNV